MADRPKHQVSDIDLFMVRCNSRSTKEKSRLWEPTMADDPKKAVLTLAGKAVDMPVRL